MTSLEDRLANNQVTFREYNESVEKGYEHLKKVAKEQNWQEKVEQSDGELHFFCECSDENCQERVVLRPSKYKAIHQERDRFVMVCGHEIPAIEAVIEREEGFCVIQKYKMPPESADTLQRTPLSNQ